MEPFLNALVDMFLTVPQSVFIAWMYCRLFRMRRPGQFSAIFIAVPNILHIVFMHMFPFHFWVTVITQVGIVVVIPCYYSLERLSKILLFTLVLNAVLILPESCYSLLMGSITSATLVELAHGGPLRFAIVKIAFFIVFFAFMIPFYLLCKKVFNLGEVYKEAPFFLFIISQFVTIGLMHSFLLETRNATGALLISSALAIGFAIAADVALLRAVRQTQEQYAQQERQQELERQLKFQETRQRQLAGKETQIDTIQQDIARRLEATRRYLAAGESDRVQASIEGIAQRLRATAQRQFCDHSVVDAVLADKYGRCEEMKIVLESALRISAKVEMDGVLLCSVFSNIMDNAIAACARLPEEERRISVSALSEGGYLIIKEKNPASFPPRKTKKTERDLPAHGLGLKILDQLARQTGGQIEILDGKQDFQITVWLKLPECSTAHLEKRI